VHLLEDPLGKNNSMHHASFLFLETQDFELVFQPVVKQKPSFQRFPHPVQELEKLVHLNRRGNACCRCNGRHFRVEKIERFANARVFLPQDFVIRLAETALDAWRGRFYSLDSPVERVYAPVDKRDFSVSLGVQVYSCGEVVQTTECEIKLVEKTLFDEFNHFYNRLDACVRVGFFRFPSQYFGLQGFFLGVFFGKENAAVQIGFDDVVVVYYGNIPRSQLEQKLENLVSQRTRSHYQNARV